MKKIVHIVESFGGGVFSYLSDLTSGLSNRYDITILYGRRQQTPENVTNYFPENVKLIEIKSFTRNLNPLADLKSFIEISKLLKKINPDIIHLHSSKAGAIGRLLFYKSNQKVFYTPHGYAFLNNRDNNLKSHFYFYIEKALGFRKVQTIACSKSEYLESLKVTKYSGFISNSIDTEKLNEYFTDNSNTDNSIFTVGRIDEQKNPALFNEIAKSMPNVNFIWFGDGDKRSQLSSDNIKITGWMPREELLSKIQKPKYFILTSKWEGLPISLLEAMYLEKICFVTDVPGNNDAITNNIDGYLFKNKQQFLENFRSKNISLGTLSKKKVEEKFSKEKMIDDYIGIYERGNYD
ncbi:glycosyltransferase [Companilactobacillus huachuanensis]|uniref:Glycosyltransferase n=1 Tax=Companilactobacillus huachuanensis TaxID=2559914 RepID=A0ABW1RNC2_9LACO|nr:glycosyltransferase [Companilactobacillus huachuanensis]